MTVAAARASRSLLPRRETLGSVPDDQHVIPVCRQTATLWEQIDRVGAPATIVKVYCAGVSVPVGVNGRGQTVCTGCGALVRVVT